MSWTRSRSAPGCNQLPFCHPGRCSKTLPNRYCWTPNVASWLFHLASETLTAGTSLSWAGISSYVPFSFSYSKTVPGSLSGNKGLHTSAEVISEQVGRRHNPPSRWRLFFLFAIFFSGSTPSKEELCLSWAEESFDASHQSEATQLPKVLRSVRLSLCWSWYSHLIFSSQISFFRSFVFTVKRISFLLQEK